MTFLSLYTKGRNAVFILVPLLLISGGCAVQPVVSVGELSAAWEKKRTLLEELHSWDLKGRIAVQMQKDGGSASLYWKQRKEDYAISIIAPFGRGTVELEGNSHGVTLRNADEGTVTASDPEALLLDYLGWQVPVSGLKYWIRGIPDPMEEIQTMLLDEQARISELSQAGWHVRFRAYRHNGDLELPVKLEMQNRSLRVKLAVRNWELAP